jgi:oligopeptide/dipeptide ABC transporter ATP-binding protein
VPSPINPPPGCVFHPRCVQAGPRCSADAPRLVSDPNGIVACHLYDGGTQLAA